ncbi:MAG TPA: sigma-70 family RNA polymerase sigma factor [Planctomycetes bacterium]|nr:sigma-70 family RNA polymerase sigma factor [Planctomycetota bacterium]HIK61837.1 sigma-70 family RNA polymerase sigma factor [Planctomycetota bacterium]
MTMTTDSNSEPSPEALDRVEELVISAQSGDVDSLNELFQRYHQTMVEMARRKLGPRLRLKEDPDDLAQTTFREAARDFQGYRYQGEGSLLRWLIQILQNKIRDKAEFYSAGKRDLSRERAMETKKGEEERTLEFLSEDLSVTQVVQRDEQVGHLRDSLTELSAEHRQAITLVFFEGLTLRQAGERMGGKSEDAVRMMLRRAEGKLGDRLRSRLGSDST